MASDSRRLRKLVEVQEQLKALHEARHAGHLSNARAAAQEAADLSRRADQPSSIAVIFPDLYNRHIEAALARQAASENLAEQEAAAVATATLRTKMIDKAYRKERLAEEREAADRERLEILGRTPPRHGDGGAK